MWKIIFTDAQMVPSESVSYSSTQGHLKVFFIAKIIWKMQATKKMEVIFTECLLLVGLSGVSPRWYPCGSLHLHTLSHSHSSSLTPSFSPPDLNLAACFCRPHCGSVCLSPPALAGSSSVWVISSGCWKLDVHNWKKWNSWKPLTRTSLQFLAFVNKFLEMFLLDRPQGGLLF